MKFWEIVKIGNQQESSEGSIGVSGILLTKDKGLLELFLRVLKASCSYESV